jgi:signal transduction histidine kinase
LFGVSKRDFVPTFDSLMSLVHFRDRQLFAQHLEESVNLQQPINHEFRILNVDGSERWINCQGQVEFDASAHSQRYFGLFVDISARKQNEQMLRRWEKLTAAARLSTAIAHEINNPLGAAVNLIFLAKTAPGVPAAVVDRLLQAEHELERVGHATRKTLGFYRESARTEQIDIPALVESELRLYSNKLLAKRINVTQEFGQCPPIHAVRGEIRHAISNIIANAIDAVRDDGVIKIGTRSVVNGAEKEVEIFVVDDGPGIPAEDIDRIFEPFYTTKEAGSGLGLWIAKEIVERHGGSIAVSPFSENDFRNEGAIFTIKLRCESAAPLSN